MAGLTPHLLEFRSSLRTTVGPPSGGLSSSPPESSHRGAQWFTGCSPDTCDLSLSHGILIQKGSNWGIHEPRWTEATRWRLVILMTHHQTRVRQDKTHDTYLFPWPFIITTHPISPHRAVSSSLLLPPQRHAAGIQPNKSSHKKRTTNEHHQCSKVGPDFTPPVQDSHRCSATETGVNELLLHGQVRHETHHCRVNVRAWTHLQCVRSSVLNKHIQPQLSQYQTGEGTVLLLKNDVTWSNRICLFLYKCSHLLIQ